MANTINKFGREMINCRMFCKHIKKGESPHTHDRDTKPHKFLKMKERQRQRERDFFLQASASQEIRESKNENVFFFTGECQ